MTTYDDMPETALRWHRDGQGAALATVVETWGSAPRPVGSQLAISGSGEIAGSVSGGCVEGAVVAEALELLGTGETRLLEFGVADEDAFAVGLACGGRIRVLVEPVGRAIPEAMLAALVEARAARRPIAYVVDVETGARRLADSSDPALGAAIAARFRSDKSGFEGAEFVAPLAPQPGEPVIRKHRYSAFKGTNLDTVLRARGIRSVVPTGVSTNVCVESTLRDAFETGHYTALPRDACASWDADLHEATLKTANARFGLVCDSADLIDAWNGDPQ